MKGFYIEVTNNLLDPKHAQNMGQSVWLFMWFLDKMTSISEEGIGLVLGGKPIIFEEVQKDIGISSRTYGRWVAILKKNEYIFTTRTPYGFVVRINKAKKRFGQRDKTNMAYPDQPQMERDTPKSVKRYAKVADVIKTRQYKSKDKTEMQSLKDLRKSLIHQIRV